MQRNPQYKVPTASAAATAVASGICFGLGEHCNCPLPQLLTPLLQLNTSLNPGTKPDPGSQNWRSRFQHSGWAARDLLTIRPGLGLFILETLKQENMQTLHSQGSGYCWTRYDIFISKIKGTFATSPTLFLRGWGTKKAGHMTWFICSAQAANQQCSL